MTNVFSIAKDHPPRAGLTISTPARMGTAEATSSVVYFSMGAQTDITPETYPNACLYIACSGDGAVVMGDDFQPHALSAGEAVIVDPHTLCGAKTETGFVYVEAMTEQELSMNNAINAGEVFKLADFVPYEKDSIVNFDVAHNDHMKFALMAFDEGMGLSDHSAPGDALIFALEGEATIGYEGQDYTIKAGENFRFAKGGMHNVRATSGQFKMGILIVLD